MRIMVTELEQFSELAVEEFATIGGERFSIAERVPGAVGLALDLKAWHTMWRQCAEGLAEAAEPTHLRVEAVDEFQAVIAWEELAKAAFLIANEDGSPLKKGYPIRLYVPDGSSDCLNVKGVVKLAFVHDPSLTKQAAYGFRNEVSVASLRNGLKG